MLRSNRDLWFPHSFIAPINLRGKADFRILSKKSWKRTDKRSSFKASHRLIRAALLPMQGAKKLQPRDRVRNRGAIRIWGEENGVAGKA